MSALSYVVGDCIRGSLANLETIQIDAGHSGLRAEGHEFAFMLAELASAQSVSFLGEHDDGSPFRSLIRKRRQLGRVGEFLLGDAGGRNETRCLPVSQRDSPGLVEQQGIHVPGSFYRPTGHRQNVVLYEPVHARDPDSGKQPANRGGNQTHQQGDQDENGLRTAGVDRERLQGDYRQQKDDGQTCEQNVQSNFIRGLLPLSPFDQGDHAIQERLAGVGSDLYFDPVGQDARTARDRRAIAAGFANHGSRFAGDCRFVHRRDTLYNFTVRGDEFTRRDEHQVASCQL